MIEKMKSFWNKIKITQKKKTNSSLDAGDFAKYYSKTMAATDDLTDNQMAISSKVAQWYNENIETPNHTKFTDSDINRAILSLKQNVSSGIDGIYPEHFIFGNSPLLRLHLTSLYNFMFHCTVVPNTLKLGLIIPILKKPALNPNETSNFRPITLSSTHCKLIELLIMPPDQAHDNQFGFREGRSTAFPCSVLHDIALECNHKGSPLYVCSLDAEKCFDSIWHDALFYKLYNKMKLSHWLLLKCWYSGLQALVRFNDKNSCQFAVTRGTKQGSILSP